MYKKPAPTNFGFGDIMSKLKDNKLGAALPGFGLGKIGGKIAGSKLGGKMMDKLGIGGGEGGEGINAKLDQILSAVGGGDAGDTQAAAAGAPTDPTKTLGSAMGDPNQDPGAAVDAAKAMAAVGGSPLAAKTNDFMATHMQHPYSNGTGGKNPTFEKGAAAKMMAVADPNTETSGLLFTGPPYGEEEKSGLNIHPTIKLKGEDHQGYQKSNVGVETDSVKVSPSAKVSFGAGVDAKSKKGYNSFSPSAKIKVKFDINKLWKNRQKKKHTPKHDW